MTACTNHSAIMTINKSSPVEAINYQTLLHEVALPHHFFEAPLETVLDAAVADAEIATLVHIHLLYLVSKMIISKFNCDKI